jgi:hypothetical protein
MGALASLVTQVTYSTDTTSDGGNAAFTGVMVFVYIAIFVVSVIGMWKTFAKAGQPGWTAIIPILNTLVLLKLVKRPWWWIILLLIPCVNIVILVIVLWDLVKSFGHGVGMFILFLLLGPIGWLVLGFGKSEYQLEKDPIFGGGTTTA